MHHMVSIERIMENFTSPAARMPYAGMKENVQKIGFTMVMTITIRIQSAALSGSNPASMVTGFTIASTNRQDKRTTTQAYPVSFTM